MTGQLTAVLREGWEGPSTKWAYFLDQGPDAGLRNTLAKLTPEEASRDVGGNSVAAHAHHLLFSFEVFGAFIAGDRTKRDWNESWRVSTVDAAAWTKLQSDLTARYEELLATIETHAGTSDAAAGGALGAVAHLAYHIGAIKQKILWSAEARPPL
jgi:hypothetical protein